MKSLAEPDLVALSGEKATFLAGGEIPIPVVEGTNATNGTLGVGVNYTPNVSIEWKQFGVGLDFTPTVLNNGIINLQLNPSVTEVNTANSLNINGTTVPSLTERKAHTAVELRDGRKLRDRRPAPGGVLPKHQPAAVARQRAGAWRAFSLHRLPEESDGSRHHCLSASRPAGRSETASGDAVRHLASVQRHRPVPHGRYRAPEEILRLCDERGRLAGAVRPYPRRRMTAMQVFFSPSAKVERCLVRAAVVAAVLGLPMALAGCASTEAFDAPFADYQQRTIMVATTGGDAVAANTALQTATPWPRYANDTNIPGDGARLAKVVQRYESGAANDSGAQASSYFGAGAGGTNGASTGMTNSPPGAAPTPQQ